MREADQLTSPNDGSPQTWTNRTRRLVRRVDEMIRGPRQYLRFEYTPAPLPLAEFTILASRPGWRAHLLEVAPGVQLRGLVRSPRQPEVAPWILFFAGNGDSLLSGAQTFLNETCEDRDWGMAVWAYRGFDGSNGTPNQEAFYQDANRCYREVVETLRAEPARLHVVGFSLGTHLAAYAAAHATAPPATLSLIAPFTTIDVVRRSRLRRWLTPDRYETLPLLAKLRCEVQLVHGSHDEALPVEHARALAEQLGDRATYLELPGRRHVETLTAPETFTALRTIVEPAG